MPLAIVDSACPNCGGKISSTRLAYGLPCEDCLPLPPSKLEQLAKLPFRDKISKVKRILASRGSLEGYWRISEVELEVEEFERFFEKATGKKPWSAQKTWAKRLMLGESFAIIAPTGVGKTTFIAVYSLYHASSKGEVYIIVPTGVLVKQVYSLLTKYSRGVGFKIEDIIAIHSQLAKREFEERYRKLVDGKYKIVVSTSTFLSRNFPVIEGKRFTLIFVDDVDALLRRSKNVDRVLRLAGFNQQVIDKATMLVLKKLQFYTKLFRGLESKDLERLRRDIERLRSEINAYLAENKIGQIVISSATGRGRGVKAKIFRELLGFEAGNVLEYFRNIVDLYDNVHPERIVDKTVEWVLKLGRGGLVYVAQDLGLRVARELVEALKRAGVRVALATSRGRRFIEEFSEGKVDVLVGIANYYGVIVRGLDLPHKIRYAIFVGVPKFHVELSSSIANPLKLSSLIVALVDCLDDEDEVSKLNSYLRRMRRIIEKLTFTELQVLKRSIIENVKLEGYLENVRNFIANVREEVLRLLKSREVLERLKKSGVVVLREVRGKLFLLIPDPYTYIQASGRTSRMFANGMSKGLSLVLVDDVEAYSSLNKQLRYYIDSYNPMYWSKVDIGEVMKDVDRDRRIILEAMRGGNVDFKEPVKSALLIVESPTKAKTIASFFGKPSNRRLGKNIVYEVMLGDPILGTEDYMLSIIATRGHILDLTSNPQIGYHGVEVGDNIIPYYTSIKRCKVCRRQFTFGDKCPYCGSNIVRDSREMLSILRKLAQEVDVVFIGTDPDSEGEKIAWDIYLLLKPYVREVKRVEFHEVTRRAVIMSLLNPRDVDVRLVDAQIVRRIEDRWIGFELSQRLWRAFGKKWLSAGRVQTPVLGWIIERYEEWRESRRKFVSLKLENGIEMVVDLDVHVKAEDVLRNIGGYVKVLNVNRKEVLQNPQPPYTTDSILYNVGRTLNLDVSNIMKSLQLLFESGLITYHRTDSTRVSKVGIGIAREYILENFSSEYFKPRSWGEGGAHECIRPTRPLDYKLLKARILEGSIRVPVKFTDRTFKLYDMIFRRFIASQMAPAKLVKVGLELDVGGRVVEYEGVGEILEPGFTVISSINVNPRLLKIQKGDEIKIVDYKEWTASLHPLYKPGDVVKLMKERGIGRPSTYSQTIEKLKKHGYIFATKRNYLIPTKSGIEIYKYLKEVCPEFISVEFTRKLEKVMNDVENGNVRYEEALNKLYNELTGITWPESRRVEEVAST